MTISTPNSPSSSNPVSPRNKPQSSFCPPPTTLPLKPNRLRTFSNEYIVKTHQNYLLPQVKINSSLAAKFFRIGFTSFLFLYGIYIFFWTENIYEPFYDGKSERVGYTLFLTYMFIDTLVNYKFDKRLEVCKYKRTYFLVYNNIWLLITCIVRLNKY